jgi:hypothetical protein
VVIIVPKYCVGHSAWSLALQIPFGNPPFPPAGSNLILSAHQKSTTSITIPRYQPACSPQTPTSSLQTQCHSTHHPTHSRSCASTDGAGMSCAGYTLRSACRKPRTGVRTSRWGTRRSFAQLRGRWRGRELALEEEARGKRWS